MIRITNTLIFLCLIVPLLVCNSRACGQDSAEVNEAPYSITQKEIRIPMSDGTELWGCLTHPDTMDEAEKFPALLVMDPYAGQCSLTYYYEGAQARQGYAVVYVHVRGSGRSEGSFMDREYSRQELNDAIEVINWLASRPWSTGKVGMYGWSWSGFNALQVAMKKPEPLKAIIANVSTENLYHEDVHYADGIFRFGTYNMFADLNLIYTPPPLNPTDDSLLARRFDQPPLSLRYLKEQTDGPFWRKSIRLDANPDTLQIPTYMIGGWYDGYRSAIARTLQYAKAPTKAVIGPWAHSLETPKPEADLAGLMVRWWDYWLKDEHTGVMDDPDLITYMRAPYLPAAATDTIPGQWQKVEQWPPDNDRRTTYYLSPGHELQRTKSLSDTLKLRYIPTAGTEAGIWWGDVLADQRPAEARSLTFETTPFKKEQALLGQPQARLWVSATARHANWIVRLSDVAPGIVTRITGAARNGTHRNSSANSVYLEPGKKYTLDIPLHFTSWIFKSGHKMRVSVSNAVWPMFWPTPYSMTTSLYTGSQMASSITLPFITLNNEATSTKLAALVGSRNVELKQDAMQYLKQPSDVARWAGPDTVIRNEEKAETTVIYSEADTASNPQTALSVTYRLSDYAPGNTRVSGTSSIRLKHYANIFLWEGATTIRSDTANFYYRHVRTLKKNREIIRRKVWNETVEREFQ